MSRREFIRIAIASALAALLLSIAFAPRPRFVLRYQLRRRLGDYQISDGELDRFFDAFEEHYGTPAPDDDRFLQIFILSTDAFDQTESRELKFVQLYHPYVNQCHNPLARL